MISNVLNNSSYTYSPQAGLASEVKASKYDLVPSIIDQYNTQVQEKSASLKNELQSIQQNAADAEKSLSHLSNEQLINFSAMNSFKSKLQHYSQLALQTGGGNFNQIQDYNSAIEFINYYESMLGNSGVVFNAYLSILEEIQPSTDLIFAQITREMETFTSTLSSKNIINDFTQSLSLIKEFINKVETNKVDLSSLSNTAAQLIHATQARIQKVLENQSKHQYYFCNKNYNEYQEELDHLNASLDLLNNYTSTLEKTESCLASITTQLKNTQNRLLELKDLNSSRVIQKFASGNPSDLKNQFYNEKPYVNHILEGSSYTN